MNERFLNEIREIPSLQNAIISSVEAYKSKREAVIKLTTNKTYTKEDIAAAEAVAKRFVPVYFSTTLHITKLMPDSDMVEKRILQIIKESDSRLAAFVEQGDISAKEVENGFYFTVSVINPQMYSASVNNIVEGLNKSFCGKFCGEFVASSKNIEEVEVEERHDNIEYEIPPRTFEIVNFKSIESTLSDRIAVYLADLDFLSEKVCVCGRIVDMREKSLTTNSGKVRTMFTFLIDDSTARMRISYFARQKSIEKVRLLKAGDSVVLTCKTEVYNGMVRPTAFCVDYGQPPEGFVPERRASKPVPKYYETIFPQPYVDFKQNDFFTDTRLPACLTENQFVVFDLETTGLNRSPSAGNMDRIIEIGAYKVIKGEIKEAFSTFVNPARKLSEEIINLTGIEQSDVDAAPTYEKVMPDFFKFIDGCYLVGHNAADFDYKFIEYYCSRCGYMTERKVFDTIPLSQSLLHLSNYKLNTVADYFHISFNHHRAADDALVTAKIFIELIKIKKSLPNLC